MLSFTSPTRRRRRPAHRAKATARMRFVSIGGVLTSAVLIGGGAFLGLASVQGTYALWDGSASPGGPTVDSGAFSVTVGGGSNPYVIPASSNLFPGDAVIHSVSIVVNNTPATLSAKVSMKLNSAPLYGFEVRAKPGPCPGTAFADGVLLSTTDQLVGTWGGAVTSTVCVQVALPLTASNSVQDKLDNITILVTAKQP